MQFPNEWKGIIFIFCHVCIFVLSNILLPIGEKSTQGNHFEQKSKIHVTISTNSRTNNNKMKMCNEHDIACENAAENFQSA